MLFSYNRAMISHNLVKNKQARCIYETDSPSRLFNDLTG